MKKIYLSIIVCLFLNSSLYSQQFVINSSNKKIQVIVAIEEGNVFYSINYLKQPVLQKSKLGVVREDEDFSKNLQFISSSSLKKINDSYNILTAKKKHIVYKAVKKIFSFKTSSNKKINIIFQVSNDGVAFQYEFPEQSNDIKKIKSETTSFHFNEATKAWLQPKTEAQSGWEHSNPSYEAHYMMDIATSTPSPGKNGWIYPALFYTNNTWLLITEAALGRTYCGTALQQYSPDNEYSINFPEDAETIPGKELNPQSSLPWKTPWRIIAIGDLKTITESTLGTDLAFPAKKMDTSFIKPGKASWSWILSKDNFIVYDEQKKYIDYAADMHWQYCLIDAAWDKKIGYEKIKELSEYANSKNVGLILWYNSAGNWNTVKYTPKDKLLTHEERIKEFAVLQQMSIKGIKVDFFGGDGQSFINYYQDILEDAATYHLLVNFHGATLPRGWQRTYPNLMTTEAVYGYEMITFSQKDADVAAQHMVMCALVRNAFDPMDFTPVSLYKIPKINRVTTSLFELATAVIFLSGIQHYVEGPEGMSKMNNDVKTFIQTVPSVWDDVKFIDGYPGKFYVVARRAGNKWYVAGINGDSVSHTINLNLSFVKQSIGKLFKTTTSDVEAISFNKNEPSNKSISINSNDGFVIEFE
jgi:hypothetical protein